METVKDEGGKDKHEEKSGLRVRKMGEWGSKLETETSLGHNLVDRLGHKRKKGLAQLVHISLQNMEGNPKLLNLNTFQLSINRCKIHA